MANEACATGFSRLVSLDLITAEQCEAVLGCPGYLTVEFSSPAQQLYWLVERRIVSHVQLIAIAHKTVAEA